MQCLVTLFVCALLSFQLPLQAQAIVEPFHDLFGQQNNTTLGTLSDLELLNKVRSIVPPSAGTRPDTAYPMPLTSCGQTEVLCPTCPIYDMLDWFTLDASLRATSHMNGTHDLYTSVDTNSFTYTKNAVGDTWDIYLFDSTNIYGWITEWSWNNPTWYKKQQPNTEVIFSPRFAHVGFPGTRVANCSTNYIVTRNCVPDTYFHSSGIGVQEIWGPYNFTPPWGNIGPVQVVKVVGFYGCSGTDSSTCSDAETFWGAKRYGEIRWAHFKNTGGTFVQDAASEFLSLLPGTGQFYFPCGLPPH